MFYDIHLQETACKSVSYDVLNGVSALLLINGSLVRAQQAEPYKAKKAATMQLFLWAEENSVSSYLRLTLRAELFYLAAALETDRGLTPAYRQPNHSHPQFLGPAGFQWHPPKSQCRKFDQSYPAPDTYGPGL